MRHVPRYLAFGLGFSLFMLAFYTVYFSPFDSISRQRRPGV